MQRSSRLRFAITQPTPATDFLLSARCKDTSRDHVPISYQRRFMFAGQGNCFRLDLKPATIFNGSVKYTRRAQHHWGPDSIFAEDDLYTTKWGTVDNARGVEQFFFGQRDDEGVPAINFIRDFDHEKETYSEDLFRQFLRYMSLQKLRTPKGLAAFEASAESKDKNSTLILLQRMQEMYCATWTECVWQIADASNSTTKFIISDHPVTVYNRACPHLSSYCTGAKDPDIRLHATHTYFPLSLDKVLILTNLSWVRDPVPERGKVPAKSRPLPGHCVGLLDIQLSQHIDRRRGATN